MSSLDSFVLQRLSTNSTHLVTKPEKKAAPSKTAAEGRNAAFSSKTESPVSFAEKETLAITAVMKVTRNNLFLRNKYYLCLKFGCV